MNDRTSQERSAALPVISIVIPVYNRRQGVEAALDSIGDSLGTRPDGSVEIVVVDDGSTDGSAGAARAALDRTGLPGQVIVQRNAGPGAARNHGARVARGRFLACLDSDDTWFPWTLQAVEEAVAEHPDAALIFLQTLDHPAGRRPPQTPDAPLWSERHEGFLAAVAGVGSASRFAACNVVVRHDVHDRLGGFPTGIRCSEDTDLFLRADREGPCIVLRGRPLVGHVVQAGDSLSGNVPCIISGLGHMMATERAGAYPAGAGGDPRRKAFLAGSAFYAARMAFIRGHVLEAYMLLFRHAGFIIDAGRGTLLLRYLLTLPVHASRRRRAPRSG